MAAAASSLKSQAQELVATVAVFKLGKGAGQPSTPAKAGGFKGKPMALSHTPRAGM